MFQDILSQIPHTNTLHIIIGSFDGVHNAHQHLITKAINIAKQKNEKSMIFSFHPLPKAFFQPQQFKGYLLPVDKKKEILQLLGADYTIITNFEFIKDFSEKQFVEILLSKTNKIIFYSGVDFRIGSRTGESYKDHQVEKVILEDIYIDNYLCRSSIIREYISNGQIEEANLLLDKEYTIYSHTVPGNKIGRSINFPTINIKPNQQIVPKHGVYFGEIKIYQKIYPAAIYVGYRPTVNGKDLRIESHIIYEFPYEEIPENTIAEVSFLKMISEEKKFKSLEELKKILYNYKNISSGLATERYKNKTNRLS